MPDIQTQSADGVTHSFPDGTKPEVIDRVMKQYAQSKSIPGAPNGLPEVPKPQVNMQGSNLAHAVSAPKLSMQPGLPAAAQVPENATAMNRGAIVGGLLTNPAATVGALGGSYAGGELGRGTAEALGAGERGQNISELGGSLLGGAAGGFAGNAFLPKVPGAIGNIARGDAISPNSPGYNVLKPGIKSLAGVVKWPVSGASLAEAVVPNRSGGPIGRYSALSNKFSPAQVDALQGPFKPVSIEPGAPEPSADAFYTKRGAEENAIFNRGTGASDAARSRSESTAFPQPLRPLIGTPEEWATYDQQKAILTPEAADAGLYHAARGATSKKLTLQERMGKKLSQ